MTLLSNDISIFGTVVPNIYVKKVTIENSGFVANPQMMDRVVAHVNTTGGNAYAQLEETFSQQQNFVQTYQGKSIKLTVDLLLKENLGGGFGDILNTWSDKQDLQEYTNIRTLLVGDSLASKLLSVGSNMIDVDTNSAESFIDNLFYSVESLAKANILTDKEKQRLQSLGFRSETFVLPYSGIKLKRGISSAVIKNNLYSIITNGILSKKVESLKQTLNTEMASSTYVEVDDDGKRIKNYKFTEVYDIDPAQYPGDIVISSLKEEGAIEFLSVLAVTTLDLEKLSGEFGLDLSFFNKYTTPKGRVANQRILENGKVSSANYVYVLQADGSVWSGPVYKEGDKYFTGNPGAANNQEVIRKQVQNSTVQDFRIIDRVSRLQFNLSFFNSDTIALSDANKFTRDNTDVIRQPAYFSYNYVSRDYDGNARFMFGVDYYSMIRDVTIFGRVMPKDINVLSLLTSRDFSQILNMSIKRKRVDVVGQSNKLGTFIKNEIPFKTGFLGESHIDQEEIIGQVVAGKEEVLQNGQKQFSSNPAANNGTMQEVDMVVPDMTRNTSGLGFRFFTGADLEIKNFTDGDYQYGVELEILDRSSTYIINKVYNLIKAYKAITGYYNFANIPNRTYSVRTGYFKKELAAFYEDKEFKPWEYATTMLANTIQEFKADEDLFDKEEFISNMLTVVNPVWGSVRGIEALQKLILNTASRLAAMAGTTLKSSIISKIGASATADATPASIRADVFANQPDKRIIKIEYWFDGSYNTEVPKRFGYDFLTPTGKSFTPSSIGLLQMPGASFNARLQAEMKKYFEVENPEEFEMKDLNGNISYTPGDTIFTSLFSYVSPASVNLGQGLPGGDKKKVIGSTHVSLLEHTNKMYLKQFYDKDSYTYMATKIMNYNNSSVIPIYDTTIVQSDKSLLSEPEDKIKFYTQQILTSRNCVAVTDSEFASSSEPESNFTGLFMSDFLGIPIDKVDTLQSNDILLESQKDRVLSVSYKGGSEVSLFLSLVYGYSNQCGGLASTKAPSQKTNKKEREFDLNFFKVSSPVLPGANVIDPLLTVIKQNLDNENPQGYSIGIDDQSLPVPVQNELRALPNQIKSLILEPNSDSRVRHQWNKLEGNPSKDPYYKAAIAMNYRNLKKIEYLAGFQYGEEPIGVDILGNTVGQFTRPMIGNPIWKTLDADIYTSAIGKTLLCRLKTYEKKEYGIEPMECLGMPVFDEYFIVEPTSYDGSFVVTPTPEPIASEVSTTSPLDQEPSDYTNSDLNIPAPTDDQKKQIDKQVFMDDSQPSEVANVDLGSGFTGGAAGGPPVDQQINLEKI
jgi:hypothetical protein